jgi:hypothetical protein
MKNAWDDDEMAVEILLRAALKRWSASPIYRLVCSRAPSLQAACVRL